MFIIKWIFSLNLLWKDNIPKWLKISVIEENEILYWYGKFPGFRFELEIFLLAFKGYFLPTLIGGAEIILGRGFF